MPNAYIVWMSARNGISSRERVIPPFTKLTESWGCTDILLGDDFSYMPVPQELVFWHHHDRSRFHVRYLTFERRRWHEAGSIITNKKKVRKYCEKCKQQVPESLRVLFELKGK